MMSGFSSTIAIAFSPSGAVRTGNDGISSPDRAEAQIVIDDEKLP
jgi:hypothetical protein